MSLGFHEVKLRSLDYDNILFLIHFMNSHVEVSKLKFITIKFKWSLLSHCKIVSIPRNQKKFLIRQFNLILKWQGSV